MNEIPRALLGRQDRLITRRQALMVLTSAEIASHLGRRWQVILPGVYATFTGPISDRHRCRAALLHAGDGALLTDLTALKLADIPYLPADPVVRVLVAAEVQRLSRDFVVLTRTSRMPREATCGGLAVVPVYRALAQFIQRHADERECLAVAAAAIQRGRATTDQLRSEASHGPARGRPRLLRIIDALDAGIRSVPENDFRLLVARSVVLPAPLWNPTLILPTSERYDPDALLVDSGVIHETNGRGVHAGFSDFEAMQRRHDRLTSAGFIVLHNTPRRLAEEGAAVLAEFEACHLRHVGRGLPAGVQLLDKAIPHRTAL